MNAVTCMLLSALSGSAYRLPDFALYYRGPMPVSQFPNAAFMREKPIEANLIFFMLLRGSSSDAAGQYMLLLQCTGLKQPPVAAAAAVGTGKRNLFCLPCESRC